MGVRGRVWACVGVPGRAWACVGERGRGGELKSPKPKIIPDICQKEPPLTFSRGH